VSKVIAWTVAVLLIILDICLYFLKATDRSPQPKPKKVVGQNGVVGEEWPKDIILEDVQMG